MEAVTPILQPDRGLMLEHLKMLFGRAMEGKIELTAIKADAGPGDRPRTRFFALDDLEEVADWAVATNTDHMWNVYVGAALRREDTFPGHAADDGDFLRAYALWADADNEEQLAAAREAHRAAGLSPAMVVITGRTPERRAQMWWPLETPIDDIDVLRRTLRGMASALGTDPAVTSGKQLMRLAGSLAWPKPKKAGRVLELTEVSRPKNAAREVQVESLQRAFPAPAQQLSNNVGEPKSPGSLIGAMAAADLRSALNYIRSDDRDVWIRMGHALRHLGDQGRGLWLEWSQTSDKYDPVDAHRVWDSLKGERTGYQAVFAEAQRRGWANPASAPRQAETVVREVINPDTGEVTEEIVSVDESRAEGIRATPYVWIDPQRIPPRDMLYGRHMFRQFLSTTVAPGAIGKSSLVIAEALAMVTGRALLNDAPKRALNVWYWNGEDPQEELQRRIQAACLHYGIEREDIEGRLFVDSGRNTEIVVVSEDRNGVKIAEPVVEAIIQQIRTKQIDVLVIDPFVACHAVPENDNTKIEVVAKQWMRVADEANCAVELVHHVRKPSSAGQETTVEDGRGAGALLAKARSGRVLNAMTAEESDELGIERDKRFGFFRVDNGKANLMPRGGAAKWYRMESVPLGNRIDTQEDEVGVVTAWQKPGALDGLSPADLMKVKIAVAGGQWREDIRAANWVGNAIAGCLGLDSNDPQARARVKSMLRIWLKTGALEVVTSFDEQRRQRQFVVVGRGDE